MIVSRKKQITNAPLTKEDRLPIVILAQKCLIWEVQIKGGLVKWVSKSKPAKSKPDKSKFAKSKSAKFKSAMSKGYQIKAAILRNT